VGKSLRSVRRYLTEEKPVQLGQVSEEKLLKQAYQALLKWKSIGEKSTVEKQQLAERLEDLLPLLNAICKDSKP
jgi:ParB family transcriptional regulator, chromosome partitioning protein